MSFRFRKRPVEIEAFQMTPDRRESSDGWPGWLLTAWATPCEQPGSFFALSGAMLLTTLEGVMAVSPGDWIIRGVKGELYPCRADIFELTYEVAA